MKAASLFGVMIAVLAVSAQGAMIRFELSPPGKDVAVGLNPSNEVPAAVGSTGSGSSISAGMIFDTDTSTLHVAAGYGSAAGFTDLTGPATAMHIHGPAGTGTNAPPIANLMPIHFSAGNPTNGGIIYGHVPWPTNQAEALLAGNTYLNIHTVQFPGGEIRGQLIPVNDEPTLVCPQPATVECGTTSELVALLSDPEGDAVTVVWTVNGVSVQTNTLPARDAGHPAMTTLSVELPLGTNVVGVTATDAANNMASCFSEMVVADTTPPVIVSASADPAILWPPNHKMTPVHIRAQVEDACSATTWKIIRVTSNQAVKTPGSGNTSPDWKITGAHSLLLRAERAGRGSDRIYTITLQASDAAGNLSATRTVTVSAPKSKGNS